MAHVGSRLCLALLSLLALGISFGLSAPLTSASFPYTLTAEEPWMLLPYDNAVANGTVWTWTSVSAQLIADANVTVVGTILFDAPTVGITPLTSFTNVIAITSANEITSYRTIPPCDSYNGVFLGDKVGTWYLNISMDASEPDNTTVSGIFSIGGTECSLTEDVLLTIDETAPESFFYFELPPFTETYQAQYQVNVTLAAGEALKFSKIVGTNTSCDYSARNAISAPLTPTALTQQSAFTLTPGTWQFSLTSDRNFDKTLRTFNAKYEITGIINGTVTPAPPADPESWWTVSHVLLYIVLPIVVVMVLLAGAVGGFLIWKRSRDYEEV